MGYDKYVKEVWQTWTASPPRGTRWTSTARYWSVGSYTHNSAIHGTNVSAKIGLKPGLGKFDETKHHGHTLVLVQAA